MKVLIVCNKYLKDKNFSIQNNWAFIYEQSESLKKIGVDIDIFMTEGKGIVGYLRNVKSLNHKIRSDNYDLVHAHYGICGFIAILQRRCPVIISFIGSDINLKTHRIISKIAMRFSAYNIFVERNLAEKVKAKKNFSIIPFGVDLNTFYFKDKLECRKKLNLDANANIALFPSSASRKVKNFALAKKAIERVGGIIIVQMGCGYTRKEVNILYNACDFLIMTSLSEGSPQVVKEAMACNCPIVSTDVGDVKNVIENVRGCYLTTFDPNDIADKIRRVITLKNRTNGRKKIEHLDLNIIAETLMKIYKENTCMSV